MTKLLLSASAVLFAATAAAQGSPMIGSGMGHEGPGPFGMRNPVTNAPYSATFTSTSAEKLQDGTVLTHTSTRVVERDSLGRTREEVTLPARGTDGTPHTMITIIDPVARTITQLRTEQKVAVVHTIPQPPQGTAGRRGPSGPPPQDGQADWRKRHEDKNVVTADLGSKTIDGVVATGKRMTRTIPAGQIGNAAPIVSTVEEWYSPDLKIELTRSDADPFRGTRTTSVSSLTKAEPAAALFTVPSGYTVKQAPERAFGRRGPGGPRPDGVMPPPPPPGA